MLSLKFIGRIATKATEGKLFTCRKAWPFDLWPDTIKLDEEKLVITHREWFIKQVITIQVKDILNIEIIAGPMLSSAKIFSRYVTGGHYDVKWLWKRDSFRLRERVNTLMQDAQKDPHVGGQ